MKLPVREVQRLHLDPGDKLVVLCDRDLSDFEAAEIPARIRTALRLDEDVPMVVLVRGMNIAVVTTP